eukprot:12442218-Alexandrium_andersonii.AAC.1
MAVRHLEGRRDTDLVRSDREGQPNEELHAALLGPVASAWEPPANLDRPTAPGGRAVLLIDQSKAFERLLPAWVRAVLEWRRVPRWLIDLIMAFILARHA